MSKLKWIVFALVIAVVVCFFSGGTANSPAPNPTGVPMAHPTPNPFEVYRPQMEMGNLSLEDAMMDNAMAPMFEEEPPEYFEDQKVLVVIFDPKNPDGGVPLSKYVGWHDPKMLTDIHNLNIFRLSHGSVKPRVVEVVVINDFPTKVDGFKYDWQSYLNCWNSRGPNCHYPDQSNLQSMYDSVDLCGKFNRGEIDTAYFYGGPWFGWWESNMTGNMSYWLNSQPTTSGCGNPMNVWLYSMHVGPGNMLHNVGHAMESLMWARCGEWNGQGAIGPHRWPVNVPECPWERFSRTFREGGWSGAGVTHAIVNSGDDYSYCKSSMYPFALKNAWENNPDLPVILGQTIVQQNAQSAWGCGQDQFLHWWYSQMPHRWGFDPMGVPLNWWVFYTHPECGIGECAFPNWVTDPPPTNNPPGGPFPPPSGGCESCQYKIFIPTAMVNYVPWPEEYGK